MKKTVNVSEFVETMTKEGFGFSYNGAVALFDYFEQYEEECETSIEFDPIAFRCEYTEYESVEEVEANYLKDFETVEDIQEYTQVIEFKGGLIIADF